MKKTGEETEPKRQQSIKSLNPRINLFGSYVISKVKHPLVLPLACRSYFSYLLKRFTYLGYFMLSSFSKFLLFSTTEFIFLFAQIAQVLTEADISVIFAVDSKLHGLYTKLAEFLPSAAVGILTDSSTNIVRLLRDNYDKIVNKAELMATYDADYLEVSCFPLLNILILCVFDVNI